MKWLCITHSRNAHGIRLLATIDSIQTASLKESLGCLNINLFMINLFVLSPSARILPIFLTRVAARWPTM